MTPIKFSGINYSVCNYCTNIMLQDFRDGTREHCGLRGGFDSPRLAFGTGNEKDINQFYGCDNFNSNGLPAHPEVHKKLCSKNSLCGNIPIDKNSIETSWEFDNKRRKYISPKNIRNPLEENLKK